MKISIALATFNGGAYLQEQLDSLSCQVRLPHELVVVDDGSTDNTIKILQKFTTVAPFPVRTYRNESRLGYGMNFLKSACLCNGDAISFCDQDDLWNPTKLSRVANAFVINHADFIVHSAEVTDANLKATGKRYPEIRNDLCLDTTVTLKEFFPGFSITVSNQFFQSIKALMIKPGFYTDAHDELICELARKGWIRCLLSECLVKYRQHGGNLIGYHGVINKLASA